MSELADALVRLLRAVADAQDAVGEPEYPGGGLGPWESVETVREVDGMLVALRAVLGLPRVDERPDAQMLELVARWRAGAGR